MRGLKNAAPISEAAPVRIEPSRAYRALPGHSVSLGAPSASRCPETVEMARVIPVRVTLAAGLTCARLSFHAKSRLKAAIIAEGGVAVLNVPMAAAPNSWE